MSMKQGEEFVKEKNAQGKNDASLCSTVVYENKTFPSRREQK